MKHFFMVALASILMVGCNSGYKIQGEIIGAQGLIYLNEMVGKTPKVLDSTMVNDGMFAFSGKVELPRLAQITCGGKVLTQFFLENSLIRIVGDVTAPESINITGSIEDTLSKHFTRLIAQASSMEQYQSIMDSLIVANPSSVAAAYLLFRQAAPMLDYQQMRNYIAGFDKSVSGSVYLTLLEQRAATLEQTSPGKPFVDFELADTTGTVIPLSSIVGQGKWVLLDFWASWCGPCRRENPNVVAAYRLFKEKGFTVVGVSLDRSKEDWLRAIAKDSLGGWTNLSDLKFWECAPAATYGVSSIPSNILIAPDGTIAARDLEGQDIQERLAKELK